MKKAWVLITILLTTILLNTSVYATSTIAEQWENSPKYPEYLKAMEAWDLKTALEIKKSTIRDITKIVLKDYIADFKDKYEAKYLDKITNNLPIKLKELLWEIHKIWAPLLIDKSEKWRNKFVKYLYNFMENYHNQTGESMFFAKKIEKIPWIKWSEIMNIILEMAKASDIEANKSPEQKRRENEEWFRKKQQKIDSTQQKIDKWNEIIQKLKSL